MKYLLVLFCSALVFSSCQKDTVEPVTHNLTAENLTNVSYGSDTSRKMDLYLPAGRTDTTKLIVMVHGGAWIEGDKADFNSFVPIIQQRLPGYAIANINYRLATAFSNSFPAQEEDMNAAIDFLVQKANEYHISKKIVLLGASAGAQMVLLQAYKNANPPVSAVVDFFGPVDMVDMYNTAVAGSINQLVLQTLLGGTPVTNPSMYQQSSPLNFVTAQSPPTIILHGEADDLVAISQSVALKNKLQSFGVINEMASYPNQGHEIWPDPIMNDAFDRIELFIKTNVH